MPTVNLELQLKFLNELDDALKDALSRYGDAGEEKTAELKYMEQEVRRARRIISERITTERTDKQPLPRRARTARFEQEVYREAAFS